ncbi:MAG: thiolase domain-containing protein [Anaerolineae bacterium]|nr:thiolase domain-containing protein [Anaerolineae bacterium]MCB9129601.1 thiolase domain-containing protein [Anaerolineales bacterium]MCB0234940.1 thiolase domain-containing protein [Anaerolineae bacterium]MCB0241781.1 thiolase domain-containing protein [Anaerolineae bacterium]MCB0248737.1 thiolase domain-containing protein [Anaerolineae bacterium]
MRPVYIVGIGQTPVGEQWERSLRHIAHDAVIPALRDAGVERVDALYVGNMLSGELVGQEHVGALVADFVGLRGIEAYKIEAACGSGGAALRTGYMAVAGGLHDVVVVAGVEKMTDTIGKDTTAGLAMAADQEFEAAEGVSFVALNALLMRRYMYEFDVPHAAFGHFAVNAHHNAAGNPNAMFKSPISLETYRKATMIADPINLMDSSPICDGAAAVVLASEPVARALRNGRRPVRIAASSVGTDSLAVHDRRDPMKLEAAWISSHKAYQQAGVTIDDIDLFELHDAFTIMAALSLEACGYAERGRGVWLAEEGEITIEGRVPVATMGGLKARGHPVGATGVYQVVEATLQLQGLAGRNQVRDANIAMTQNIGGSGATVATHILVGE